MSLWAYKLTIMDEQKNCHCGKATRGFVCSRDDCGAKSDTHDPDHKHDDVNTCEACCTGCDKAQSRCVDCVTDTSTAPM